MENAGRREQLAPLRAPLAVKVIGANLFVVAVLVAAWMWTGGTLNRLSVALMAFAVLVHLALILIALRPIRDLEEVAARVWAGDYAARVEKSSMADHSVIRVGAMFNMLLDGLATNHDRMRAFAADVIAEGDRERSELARELRDSTAQQAAALMLQLSALQREATDPRLAVRVGEARDAAERLVEEVRELSQSVYSSVLDDLGLGAALRKLARDASAGNGVDIDVDADDVGKLPRDVASVLFHVAQEAVANATRHGAPHRVHVAVRRGSHTAQLQVHDDGRGFDPETGSRDAAGMGLPSMRERLALLDGRLDIHTALGAGTTITATVPLDGALGHRH